MTLVKISAIKIADWLIAPAQDNEHSDGLRSAQALP
jgi:hypothetical protein